MQLLLVDLQGLIDFLDFILLRRQLENLSPCLGYPLKLPVFPEHNGDLALSSNGLTDVRLVKHGLCETTLVESDVYLRA